MSKHYTESEMWNILSKVAAAVGGYADPRCSLEFMGEIPREVESVVQRCERLQAECKELQQENNTLLKDRARLDWLADVDNKLGGVTLPRDIVERNLHSMRAAIDEAMAVDSLRRGK